MSEKNDKKLLIIAGETSGDLHGAALISQLKELEPELKIYGIGGDKMKSAGMEILFHINKLSFLGFLEIIKHLPFIHKVKKNLLEFVKNNDINNIVLIDYPGFNLNIAKKFKSLDKNIVYYISPQIWAWGAGRIKKIKRLINKMLVVFPFENELYHKNGVDSEFVGHPLVKLIGNYNFLNREELYRKYKLDNSKDILFLMSGSRKHEVETIFPECIKAAEKIAITFNLQIVVACADNIDEPLFYSLTPIKNFKIIKPNTYDFMKYSKFGIIKSGTSTLESALLQLPMVVVYKTSFITYLISKVLIKIKLIGMVNIISGSMIAPEIIQSQVKANVILNEVEKILSNKKLYEDTKLKLSKVKDTLGGMDASKNAARIIYKEFS